MPKRLSHIRRRSLARYLLLEELTQSLALPLAEDRRYLASWIAVEAANGWATFLRRYYLASATGALLTSGSSASATPFRTETDAVTYAIQQLRPRVAARGTGPPWTHRDEPDWLDPGNVSDLLNRLGCLNAAGFMGAVSLGSAVHQDLLTYRNFVGHRNAETAGKVRRLVAANRLRNTISPIANVNDPLELPLQLVPQRPYSLLYLWLTDLRTMVSLVPE